MIEICFLFPPLENGFVQIVILKEIVSSKYVQVRPQACTYNRLKRGASIQRGHRKRNIERSMLETSVASHWHVFFFIADFIIWITCEHFGLFRKSPKPLWIFLRGKAPLCYNVAVRSLYWGGGTVLWCVHSLLRPLNVPTHTFCPV
jgi:hypothetical protein